MREMENGIERKWSVEEFYGLIRHHLVGKEGPVELIEGRIVPLPSSEQQARQVERLSQQIQQNLEQAGWQGYEVRSHHPIKINTHSELRPTLTICSTHQPQQNIHWVIEIDKAEFADNNRYQDLRSHLYARQGITEYWALSTQQVALRTYHSPKEGDTSTSCHQLTQEPITQSTYKRERLLHVGEQVQSVSFPTLTMQIQEPLPLYFLTRSATGHHTYIETALPLKVLR